MVRDEIYQPTIVSAFEQPERPIQAMQSPSLIREGVTNVMQPRTVQKERTSVAQS